MANDEYCTPEWLIAKARRIMRAQIEFDPASNAWAQSIIKATVTRSKDDIGEVSSLQISWSPFLRIWCNPPYSMPLVEQFAYKMNTWIPSEEDHHGFLLVNSSTAAHWYQACLNLADAACFFNKRISFLLEGIPQKNNRHCQTLFYYGNDENLFIEEMSDVGTAILL